MPTLTLLDDAMLRAGRMVPAVHRLGGGTIAMAGSQQPWRVVGAESVVYQLRQSNGRVLALRCLLTDKPDPSLAERYRALGNDATLRRLRSGENSPIVGQITYIAEGMTLPGPELRSIGHPVIAMDWVMGPTLLAAADRASRSRDQQFLGALAQAWRTAMDSINTVQFVHGNLTGDNAMVRPREGFALVDYDTASWPGAPMVRYVEARPGYRHPKGVASIPERRDDFAALVIYTSLRILAHWPDLRDEHGDPASRLGGTLLFTAHDLANPDGSALFGKIRALDDREVQALIAALRDACRQKPDDVPSFLEVARGAVTAARQVQSPGQTLRPLPIHEGGRDRQQKRARLNGFLLAGDDDGAYDYWRASKLIDDPAAIAEFGARMVEIERRRAKRVTQSISDRADRSQKRSRRESSQSRTGSTPPEQKLLAAPERKKSAQVERLRLALDTWDAAAVAELWPQVKDEPEASRYAAQANDAIAKMLAESAARAIEGGNEAAIVRTVDELESRGYAVGTPARQAARAAGARLDARERLTAALASDDREAIATMALTGELDELGDFDEAVTRQIMRALATPHLRRAVASDDDNAIYTAFEADVFGGIGGVPVEIADRVALAVSRVRWLKAVRSALKHRDATALDRTMATIPEGAEDRLSASERARIGRMQRRSAALAELETAIASGNDNAIVDALGQVEAAGATLPPDLDWSAIRGVIDRLSLISSIRRAASSAETDFSRLARLLAQAREEMGGTTPYLGAGLDFDALEHQVTLAARRSRIREALKSDDDRTIVAAALPDQDGAISTLEPSERDRVQRAIANHRGANPLAPKDDVIRAPLPAN
jgi:hypothetical protein